MSSGGGPEPEPERCARRSHRPRHRPALAVPRCMRLLPESVRRLTPGGFASPTRHSTADARRGHRSDLAILLSPSARERFHPEPENPWCWLCFRCKPKRYKVLCWNCWLPELQNLYFSLPVAAPAFRTIDTQLGARHRWSFRSRKGDERDAGESSER